MTETIENRIIKGLWSLTGLKSSDYIKLVKDAYPNVSGSRLRGLISGVGNRNFRPATAVDLEHSLCVIAKWAGTDIDNILPDSLTPLLTLVDRELGVMSGGALSVAARKEVLRKILKNI